MPGVVDNAAQNRKCAPAKNVTKKATDEENKRPVNRCNPVQGSRKEVKTLTSILTTRSKVNLEVNSY